MKKEDPRERDKGASILFEGSEKGALAIVVPAMSGPAASPAAEARRQPPRRTATDAKRKIEDGDAAAYERMSDEDLQHISCESQSEKATHHGEGRSLVRAERQVYWRCVRVD